MKDPRRKLYGSKEFAFAEPFINALVDNPSFRTWVLQQTKFAALADGSRVLSDEMGKRRNNSSTSWWRSHYTTKCPCQGCVGGQETDILAIFETASGMRFALHFEVKQPEDRFPTDKDQPANYQACAECWSKKPPKAVLPHACAATVLLCSARKQEEYAPHASKFGTIITFEDIKRDFPHITLPPVSRQVSN
jgi:hypothetical protein